MLRNYSKVSPLFWIGETGRALRGDAIAQIVGMYLVTCQHANMIGAFICPPLFIAHETGHPLEEVLKALQRLAALGFCEFDASKELIWVCEMAKYQIGESLKPGDKRVPYIEKEFKALPECRIKRAFYERYKTAYHLPEIAGYENDPSPFEAPSKPLRSLELELELELKQEQKTPPTPPGGETGKSILVHRLDTPAVDVDFEKAKAIYPRRDGGQNWRQAHRAWMARIREGCEAETLLAGTRAYAEHIRRLGKEGTPYVKQAATFYGKDKHFLEILESREVSPPSGWVAFSGGGRVLQ